MQSDSPQAGAVGRLDMEVEVRDKDGNLKSKMHLIGYVGGPSMQDANTSEGDETNGTDSLNSRS